MAHRFGSRHTETKLHALEKYLRAYSTALKKLKNKNIRLTYFDAFAGTGDIQIADADATLLDSVDDYSPFIKGSAQRALELKTAFDCYVFVEKSKRKIADLKRLCSEHPDIAERVDVRAGDANKQLQSFCKDTDWARNRAVVFLDPYGNQVSWETIVTIAETKAIDLWYLFPAGLGVHRQIAAKGSVHETHEASLDKLLGTPDWRNDFIETKPVNDLFGSREIQEKRATVESITRFAAKRMKEVFKGGVLDEWLPLGSRRIHMYSLMFAWANSSKKASQLAETLAHAVLRSKRDGRTK